MDLQFNKTAYPCLRNLISREMTQEQTQEVRLPDSMPDIGRVIGCWGQIVIRGKEWRSNGMSVSGGVMAWVLYAPEDDSQPQSLEAWIPFQMRWDFPQTQRDGFIRVEPYLQNMDCRSISARKLLLRASVSVFAEASEPADVEVAVPGAVPEDVRLLKNTYPLMVPQEAGEKPFQTEEIINIPSLTSQSGKIVRYEIQPMCKEYKVMAGKLVFRGQCTVRMLYMDGDGVLHTEKIEMPFSQLTDLDRDYSSNADADISFFVTGAELEQGEDAQLHMRCGLTAQYEIFDRCMIEVTEDVYSNLRSVQSSEDTLHMPTLLDKLQEDLSETKTMEGNGQKILDATVLYGCPQMSQNGDSLEVMIPCQLDALYLDEAGTLQCWESHSVQSWNLNTDGNNRFRIQILPGASNAEITGDGITVSADCKVNAAAFCDNGIRMVTALELGDMKEADPNRPSLILRRAGQERVWDLAKKYGSTVEAIYVANQIQQEPPVGQMLLIPVE